MAAAPSLAELLDGHITLDVECFDRLYLNAYVPTLQTPGGTVYFLHDHLGHPIPSPALFRPPRGPRASRTRCCPCSARTSRT